MSASKKMEARGGTIRRVLQLIAPIACWWSFRWRWPP